MTWWTYIFPKTIFRASSRFNRDIRVVEVYGKRKLLVEGSRQSGTYMEKLWKEALRTFGFPSGDVGSILILGVAGGTVIHLLRKLYPDAHITGIDIDKTMIDIGKKYFGLNQLANTSFLAVDAKEYVGKERKKYDLVIVDMSSGRHIPNFVLTDPFLDSLKKLLSAKGQLIINYLRENEYKEKPEILFGKLNSRFSTVKDTGMFLNRFFWAK